VAATLFPRNERMSTAANRTTRASHSSSVPAVGETSYLRCSEGWIGYDVAGAGSLVVLVPGMGDLRAGYRFLGPALRAAGYRVACTDLRGHGDSDTAAQRPGLVRGLVLAGPFVRNGKTSARQRLLLRVAMAPPWAAISWKSYLPKLYAGRRPADFEEYRDQVIASLRRPGHAKAFSATTRTSHDLAEARRLDITTGAVLRFLESVTGHA
jgi:pimeloyl-ACP methyl ester carboxylesterase